ncbi:MAG: oligosaccharide flippase family protein [Gammaproteobacteria bacterium]|nr:oligosaccharide flippase family protein [Gammaproteobacteria bacterium]
MGIKFFQRLVGLISILFLARLLTPEDFAIVALVAITVHFFDILSNAGSEQYIIQKGRVSIDDLNTAWTIDLSMKSLLWVMLILSAPLAATFFENPELENALLAASFILLINAAKNPGLFLKKQNFEYGQIFWLSVLQRVLTFIIVIAIAYIEQSYWALIIGDIVSSIIYTAGSYKIDKHRPKLCFDEWKTQWHFSGWLLLKSIIGYIRSQIDILIVSKLFPHSQLGQYYMARDIAMLPSHNLLLPAIEPLLALFRTSRNDLEAFEFQVRLSLFVIISISIPISIFIFFFSESIVLTLLGSQWITAIPILSVMSLLLFYFSIILILEQSLLALQKTRTVFLYDLVSLIFITTGLLLSYDSSLTEIGLIRGLLGITTMLFLVAYMKHLIGLKVFRLLILTLPVISASLLSSWIIISVSYEFEEPVFNLIEELVLYVFLFCLFSALFFFKVQLQEVNKLKVIFLNYLNNINFLKNKSGKL